MGMCVRVAIAVVGAAAFFLGKGLSKWKSDSSDKKSDSK